MDDDRTRAEKIVEAVRFMRARDRDGYLARHCTEPELRAAVDQLLERAASSATEERPVASSDASASAGPTVMHPHASRVPESADPGTELPGSVGGSPPRASGLARGIQGPPGLVPGTRVGPYAIQSVLGIGGFGAVYRAVDDAGATVALKTVLVPRAGLLHSIRREVLALSQLRHPGIVPVVAEGIHEGLPWYAMELLEGRALSHLVAPPRRARDGRVGADPEQVRRVLRICRRLCSPLAYLHGEGLVHRDLKPDNVLLRSGGVDRDVPVLVDFGLTVGFGGEAMREALEVGGLVVGTITYMSPEQVRGELVDARSDLYALGCLMFELLTSRPPFVGLSAEVMRLKQEGEPPSPSSYAEGIPDAVDALVRQLLASEPGKRLGYASDVAAALTELLPPDRVFADAPRARTYLYRPGFAGREDELQELGGAIAALRRGAGGLVLLGGPSGMGKTRLASEAARTARVRSMEILTGDCPSSAAAPLQAFKKPLLAISDRCLERGRRETDRILGRRGPVLATYEPSIAGLPGQEAHEPPPELPPREARLRLYGDLFDALVEVAVTAPVVIVLDDLHWADELSLGFLTFLVRGRRLAKSRILILATYREEEAPEALRKLAAMEGATSIRVGRLQAAGIARMTRDMLALAEAPRALVSFLEWRSEGNPFYVAQYLRVAVEQGLIVRDDQGRWRVGDSGAGEAAYETLPLPQKVRELVVGHLALLGEGARRVVDAAAILGKAVPVELLGRVAGLAERDLLAAIQELLTRQMAQEDGPQLALVHDRIRQVAYEQVPPEPLRQLHALAAQGIEDLFRVSRTPWLASLGHHWERAGEVDRARACYFDAGRAAIEANALGEAERLYRAYFALTPETTLDSVRARLWLGAKVLPHRGKIAEGIEELARASREADELGDAELRSRTLHNLATFQGITGNVDVAVQLQEEALAVARTAADRGNEADILTGLALLEKSRGRLDAARAGYESALAKAHEAGQERLEGIVLGNLANLSQDRGALDEAGALYERAIPILRRARARREEGAFVGNLALLRREQEDLEEARRLCEEAITILLEIGDRLYVGFFLATLASLNADEGRVKDALRLCDRALASVGEISDPAKEAYALLQRVRIERLALGNVVKAEELAARIGEITAALGDDTLRCAYLCEAGRLELFTGRPCESLAAAEAIAGRKAVDASIARELARLRRAAESPERLFRGERWEEIRPGLRDWLVESRQAVPPTESRA